MFGPQLRKKYPAKWLTITAMMMAMNIAMSSFGVPVPGGHLYLNDAVICVSALLLDVPAAFAVGGIGSFLGDFFFYPAPMFVSLFTHGLQAVAISIVYQWGRARGVRKEAKASMARSEEADAQKPPFVGSVTYNRLSAAVPALLLGVIINVAGYTLGRAFIYGTPEAALLKLPFQIFQAAVGAAVGIPLCVRAEQIARDENIPF